MQIKPVYLIALVLIVLLAAYIKISNPYREYSTQGFWEQATLESVYEIPDEALKPGNRNGPVLMWAAIGSSNPKVLSALVERGADVNESDGIFKGTPLTGAAGYTKNTEIIDELIRLGADINKKVHNSEDALMIAAQYNSTPGVIERLVYHGAKVSNKNKQGKTALELARKNKNKVAILALEVLQKGNI